jgi:hypothetical protein
VAYAWEFGSHGGVAPEEIETFVLHPRHADLGAEELRRPDALYRFFDREYRRPGRGRRPTPEPRPAPAGHRHWA